MSSTIWGFVTPSTDSCLSGPVFWGKTRQGDPLRPDDRCRISISFFIAIAVAVHKGNLFRTLISGSLIMTMTLWITNQTIPWDEISRMKEKNIAVEILKKLMAEQVSLYKRTNVVQSQKFSEKIAQLMNAYYNGLITNEEVIKELLKTAEEITNLYKNGQKLGLTQEELAFYDALTKPEHITDFYKNDQLIALTKELTEMLRRNRTIDWQKKETARATMRKMVKRLLKKYDYPPEDYDFAITTVISQCELWTDNGSGM